MHAIRSHACIDAADRESMDACMQQHGRMQNKQASMHAADRGERENRSPPGVRRMRSL
jgi:hypothetical protein